MDISVNKKEKSVVEITFTLPADAFEKFEQKALLALQATVKMDGFRDGKAPLDAVKSRVGNAALLDEMAHMAVIDAYPKIIAEHAIDAIGRPSIMIKKLAFGNPFECVITTTVMPDIAVGDYKKNAATVVAAQKLSDVEVTQEEIDGAIKELSRFRAHQDLLKTNPEAKISDVKDEDLPELTDEYVKTIGTFASKEEFLEKLSENMRQEKIERAKEKNRIDILEAVVGGATIAVPELLVDYELSKMLAQLEHDITRAGLTLDGYLQQSGKTKDDIKKEWYGEAEKRAKMQLVLNHIAEKENLIPSAEEISHEVSHMIEHYKGQDVDPENIKAYVVSMLTNQKVIHFLEEAKA